jgi:hypothetical protein
VKSSYQFYRMILLTRHFPKNNSIEFKNPGRDRKLESMEYFSFETQKDGNVISESGGADTVLSYLNFQTPRAIDSPRERDTPNKHCFECFQEDCKFYCTSPTMFGVYH